MEAGMEGKSGGEEGQRGARLDLGSVLLLLPPPLSTGSLPSSVIS